MSKERERREEEEEEEEEEGGRTILLELKVEGERHVGCLGSLYE